ncbi:MAG: hypothetical protein EXQ79_00185 [Acidimicrobiia bacterium]|nr:hypothetical protein [Acidimicrobiia bacterium]
MTSRRTLRVTAALLVLGMASFVFTGTAIAKKKKFDKAAAKAEITMVYETYIQPGAPFETRIEVIEDNENPEVIANLEAALERSGGVATGKTLSITFVNRKLAQVDVGIYLDPEALDGPPLITHEDQYVVFSGGSWVMSLDGYCYLGEQGGTPCSPELLDQAAELLAKAKKGKKI